MLTIRKNGVIISQAKDNPNYKPTYETEKDKPKTLYVNSNQDKNNNGGLQNGS